jgi:hypothetical protein
MNERDLYPNLPADVEILHCTATNPMPAGVGDKVVQLKQLWIHDDAKETEASQELDGSTMICYCPNCDFTFEIYLGD